MSSHTAEEWYFELDKRAQALLGKLQSYLEQLNAEGRRHYLKFGSFIKNDNELRFDIGHRKMIVSYLVNIKEMQCHFTTGELKMNNENHEVFGYHHIPELDFICDAYEKLNFLSDKEQRIGFQGTPIDTISTQIHDYPADYLNQVKKIYKTI